MLIRGVLPSSEGRCGMLGVTMVVMRSAFLAAVRRAVGGGCRVIATLDLHSNISERMIRATDCMVAMRTYSVQIMCICETNA